MGRTHSSAGAIGGLAIGGLAILVSATFLAACGNDSKESSGPTTTRDQTGSTTTVKDRAAEPIENVNVFRSGEDGYATYRIPAVVRSNDGTLIAFAEGRVTSAADDGNVDLLAKRSSDGGQTWGKLELIADMGSDFIGNPSPVVDSKSGRIILLATYKNAADKEIQILTGTGTDTSRQFLLTSDDDGISWSEPEEITSTVKKPEWRWYSVGPGHAFQLSVGPHKGRLVAPANHSDANLNYGAHLIFSDDGGKSWSIGAVDTPQGGPMHPNEATGAQVADGTIVVSARDQQSADEWHRLRATSTDGGESFTGPFVDQVGLLTPIVQASMLWFRTGDTGTLLFSAPSSVDQRVDLRVRTSEDSGVTWSEGLLLNEGPSGYSDLVAIPGSVVGVLFEAGQVTASERIDFATFGSGLLSNQPAE